MVFSSPTFLFVFLPVTLLVLAVVRQRQFQSFWLLGMSALFYLWGAGGAIVILVGVTLISFIGASLPKRKHVLAGIIAALLVPIVIYKYLPPLAGAIDVAPGLQQLILPLGISFFTFHAISYVIDVYRGTVERETNLRDYALYLFVFPHQIAGPIVRYSEIRAELKGFRDATLPEFGFGFTRFTWGLTKKVLVADQAGQLATIIFDQNAQGTELSLASAWLGAFLYALQIYFDFSGYSDMAIGLALMLGFKFPENFFQPYRSISVTDFWRRWHITLSRWFRDYVYFPLGGNRHGMLREYGALLIVFFLTSLWHGGTWNFLIWGGLHSAALIIERATGLRSSTRFLVLRRVLMLVFITVSWVPFRTESVGELGSFWHSMVAGSASGLDPFELTSITPLLVLGVIVGVVSLFGPRGTTGFRSVFGAGTVAEIDGMRWRLAIPLTVALFILSSILVLWSDFSPFLYFKF